VALKKPADIFGNKSENNTTQIIESDNSFRDELIKVDNLSEQITQLQQELSQKVIKNDLESLVLSQINNMQENFNYLQNDFKKSNRKDISEFKERVSELTRIVENLVENEIPKYKKQITKTEFNIGDNFNQFKEVVEENIVDIKEGVDSKVNGIVEILDNNLEYFNTQLQETSIEVKKTTDTYNKLSKIVENKVLKENEKLEEYSQIIQSLHKSFVELEKSLQEETSIYNQIIEDKFETISLNVNERISSIDEKISDIGNEVSSEILNIKTEVVINEQHFKSVDKYIKEHHQELVQLKEEVFGEIEKLPVGNLQENLERLEKKIDFIKETYSKIEPEVIVKEVIKEGLLNIPPETKNSDPLTPLNQNFVTLDQLQQHYRLFINRIQQQISTLGGGGETQLKYLDDIVGIATNPSDYDGKFLKYDHSIQKFIFVTVSGGGGSGDYATLSGVSTSVIGGIGSITSLSVSGVSTFTNGPVIIGTATSTGTASQPLQVNGGAYFNGLVGLGTTNPQSTLHVLGNVLVAAGASTDQYITLKPYELNSGTLSWEGSAGQLFSITNNLTSGSIFSVNDISGIPSIDVDAGGAVTLGAYSGNIGIGTTNPTSKLHVVGNVLVAGITTLGITTATNLTSQNLNVSGVSTFTDIRIASSSEKSTLVSGNTVSLVYNTGGGNVAICTNPTGPITLNVTGIPTDTTFDNRMLTFSVVAIQTSIGYACTAITLNGVSKTIKYPGAVVSTASTSSYDIFNLTGINTVGSASTTVNYDVLGIVNGNFK
jgi:hypothetical protein